MPTNCSEIILSEEYGDFIISYTGDPQIIEERYPDNCLLFPTSDYFFLYQRLENRELTPRQAFSYFSIPKLYAPIDTTSMEVSGITQNQNNPLLNLTGEKVLIGFIDSGIDWQNPVFLGEDGNSRIAAIWDQTIQPTSGDPFSSPESFPYGTEFPREAIHASLRNETAPLPTRDETGHGTFVAGIAAGRKIPTAPFTGAAPNASIAMVKLKPAKSYLRTFFGVPETAEAYQENDIIAGVSYLTKLARKENMPLVLCITTGTSNGSHDGTAPLGQVLDTLALQVGCAVVCAAGNEGGESHHYFGTLDQADPAEQVDLRVAEGENGFTVELWANLPDQYSISFTTPSGESIPETIFSEWEERRLTFRLDPTVIYISYHEAEIGTGSQLILMRFLNPSRGIWKIRVRSTLFLEGVYHMWLPITDFVKEDTVFLRPNPNVTITEPGNALALITISTYNHNNNSIYIHSGRGYTRSGRIKPDIAAPGVNVFGPTVTHMTADRISRLLQPAPRNEMPTGEDLTSATAAFTRRTGSCIAAAHAAGAAADLLEWGILRRNHPGMNSTVIKSMLIRGAKRNPVYTYPNREFGYGTLDLYQSLLL